MSINAFLVLPLAAFLADRVNRFAMFVFCLAGSTLQPIVFWSYVHWITIPSPAVAIGFHAADAALDHLGLIALWPLLYESSSPDDRGSLKAGFLIVGGIVSFVSSNLLGLWIKHFSYSVADGMSYDYMSGYLLIFLAGICACILAFFARPRRHELQNL
jgi:MFS family permease